TTSHGAGYVRPCANNSYSMEETGGANAGFPVPYFTGVGKAAVPQHACPAAEPPSEKPPLRRRSYIRCAGRAEKTH
ncbi:MAG: hypothetical protein PUE41_06350, partial [bacterium]|nr:hypothetical protein [bacterium]